MSIFRKAKPYFIFHALFSIIVGIGFLISPDKAVSVICYIIGGFATLLGAVIIFSFFLRRGNTVKNTFGLIAGIFSLTAGIILLVNPKFITNTIFVIAGIALVLSSAFKLWTAFELKDCFAKAWWVNFFLSLIGIAAGFFLVIKASAVTDLILRVVGAAMIIDGIETVISLSFTSSASRSSSVLEAPYRDVSDASDKGEKK